jgi:hypothetical protein
VFVPDELVFTVIRDTLEPTKDQVDDSYLANVNTVSAFFEKFGKPSK